MSGMKYPTVRLRRLRENPLIRNLVGEHSLMLKELVQPLFIKEGLSRPVEIASMPGQYQFSTSAAIVEASRLEALGLSSVILFGIPARKDAHGREAFAKSGVVQKAVAAIKKKCPKLLVITDVCLCEYLSHGHCGLVTIGDRREAIGVREKKYRIENDATLPILAKTALSHARAGADAVAPSDMMDGRVAAIRQALDKNNFKHFPVISYAVKYTSAFYAPFREAAESAPGFGDRSGYQMDPANADQALREVSTDLEEGADMILVKPAAGNSDILWRIKEKFACPVGAYSVSGEYAMIKAAAQKGWLDERRTVLETHLALKRAGAGFIFTYWAAQLARWKAAEKGVSR